MKRKYTSPKLTAKKIALNSFYKSRDSMDELGMGLLGGFNSTLYAQYGCDGGVCLVSGTPITFADGSVKPIEEITKGDSLVSIDVKANRVVINKVGELFTEMTDEYLVINNSLKITPEHHVWVNGHVWGPAKTLRIGDKLLNGDMVAVEVFKIERIENKEKVFNLRMVESPANYIAADILVHNRSRILANEGC